MSDAIRRKPRWWVYVLPIMFAGIVMAAAPSSGSKSPAWLPVTRSEVLQVVSILIFGFLAWLTKRQIFNQKEQAKATAHAERRNDEDRQEVKRLLAEKAKHDEEQAKLRAAEIREVKTTLETSTKAGAAKVEEVKQALDEDRAATAKRLGDLQESTDKGLVTLDKVHVLSNSNMAAQMKIAAFALRRVADSSRKYGEDSLVEDEKAAEIAEAVLSDHEAKQKIVDKGETIA